MADLPLGLFISVALLSGVGWLATGRGFYLYLVGVFGAAAAVIKSEGLPELLLLFLVLGLFFPARRASLWLVVAMAAATAVPWLAWRAAHGVGGRIPLSEGLDPSFLADRIERLGPGLEALVRHLLDPTDWLLVVPLAVGLSLVGFLRERRAPWLVVPVLLGVGVAFLAWSYWADRDEIGFLVATSAYRTIDPLLLTAAVATPLLAELVLTGPDRPSLETSPARTGR